MFENDLAAVRVLACQYRPYFSSAYHALIPVECKGIGTFGVSKDWKWYYDPEVFFEWTLDEAATALAHEIRHLLQKHNDRFDQLEGHRDAFIWNLATDCAINGELITELQAPLKDQLNNTLLSGGEKLPTFKDGKPVLPATFGLRNGETAEWYYEELMQHAVPLQSTARAGAHAGNGSCGSCHGGDAAPWETDTSEGGVSSSEEDLLVRQVASAVKDYVPAAGRGTVPLGVKRWADNILQPKINYMRWLRSAMTNATHEIMGKADYSWTRRSRRQGLCGKIIMPGMCSYQPRVGVGIDTSGSMSEAQLARCMAEVKGVLAAVGYKDTITVASCDAALHTVQQVANINQIDLKGGGGTDMGVAISGLMDVRPKLNLLILLTDCDTPWPAERPPVTLVVVKVGTGAPPPWPCHLVEIPVNEQVSQ